MALTDKLTAIADAIRAKTGGTATMTLSEMPTEIASISGGGITPTGTISINQNGTFDVTSYASALVAVSGGGSTSGTVTPADDLRTLTIAGLAGKTNFLVIASSDISAPSIRIHWGCLFLGGVCKMIGSTNSGGTGWTFTSTLLNGTGACGSADTFDSSTGTISITAGTGSNSGGYFASGVTYSYIAW